jgi:riboflavin kinase / FMN adenylyltransferase
VIVGYDVNYGCERAGSIATLRAHGQRAGFEVIVLDPVELEGSPVSSTRVRQALRSGEVEIAARLLDRRWDVDGIVVHGAKRGRTIGVPTANIAPDSELLIAPGIYAVTLGVVNSSSTPATISRHLPAVASLGRNPTFVDDGSYVLEVHVLDWDGDLYDQRVRTTFVARLRDERKFDSIDALIEQIRKDIADARTKFAESETQTHRAV